MSYHRELGKLAKSPTLERAIEAACALPFAEPGAVVFGGSEDAQAFHARNAVIAIGRHRTILEAIENREGARAESIALTLTDGLPCDIKFSWRTTCNIESSRPERRGWRPC